VEKQRKKGWENILAEDGEIAQNHRLKTIQFRRNTAMDDDQ
jgi:hypothetical protein